MHGLQKNVESPLRVGREHHPTSLKLTSKIPFLARHAQGITTSPLAAVRNASHLNSVMTVYRPVINATLLVGVFELQP